MSLLRVGDGAGHRCLFPIVPLRICGQLLGQVSSSEICRSLLRNCPSAVGPRREALHLRIHPLALHAWLCASQNCDLWRRPGRQPRAFGFGAVARLGFDPVAVVDDDISQIGKEIRESAYTKSRSLYVVSGPITAEILRNLSAKSSSSAHLPSVRKSLSKSVWKPHWRGQACPLFRMTRLLPAVLSRTGMLMA